MDGDDDLQLNLAGFEVTSAIGINRSKENRRTFAFKKQQKVSTTQSASVSGCQEPVFSRKALSTCALRCRSRSRLSIEVSIIRVCTHLARLHPHLQLAL